MSSMIEVLKNNSYTIYNAISYKVITAYKLYAPVLKLYSLMTFFYLRFSFWLIIWIPFGFVATILTIRTADEKQYYNCIGWALRKWVEDGGYIAFRWCNCAKYPWMKWPHFLWLDEKTGKRHLMQYTTDSPDFRGLPKLWFHGAVRRGDSYHGNKQSRD